MTTTLDPEDIAAKLARVSELSTFEAQQTKVHRSRLVLPSDFRTPGELAKTLDPSTVQTPALDLIDDALRRVQLWMEGDHEEGIDRLIISMPPQEGKSERVTHYGSLWWLQQNPNLRIGLTSYGLEVVRRSSYAIRNDIITHNGEEGNIDLGLRLRKDTKAAARWNLDYPHRGGIYAVSLGGEFTGRPIDALIIDDPVKDPRAAESVFMSEAAWAWWSAVARPRLAPNAPVVMVLTRWHELDLAGRLKAQQRADEESSLRHFDRWTVLNIPAQADHDPSKGQTDPLGREPGEYMISARGRTFEQWEATKAATPPVFWTSLYQGRPTPDQGDVWQEPWWGRYNSPLWSRQPGGVFRVTEPHDLMLQSWDMSFKDKASSDFVVGQVWLVRGADAYLLDQVHGRLSFTATIAEVRALSAKWPQTSTKLVEDKANGTAVIDSLKHEITGLTPVEPTNSKYGRAVAVSPFVRSGNVHLPKDRGVGLFDVDTFLTECNAFPNGAHDDQVDATSQALHYVFVERMGIGAVHVPTGRIPTRSTGSQGSNMPAHQRRMLERQIPRG